MNRRRIISLVGVIGLAAAIAARADTVRAGAGTFTDVRILGLADGALTFRMPDGRIVSQPVGKVARISLAPERDPMAETLSRAESLWAGDKGRKAAPLYRQVRSGAEQPWLRAFATLRLALVYDRLGSFTKALEAYLALAEAYPGIAAAVVPRRLPRAGSRSAAEALSRIDDETRRRSLPRAVQKTLRSLRKRIDRGEGTVDDNHAAGKSNRRNRARKPAGSVKRLPTKESSALRKQARAALDRGDLKTAAELVSAGMRAKAGAEREAWLLLTAELECARKRYARAGLAAMRLVILHPDSKRAGDALYWAGRAYEGMKRPEKALELYNACLAHKETRSALRKRAKDQAGALARLTHGDPA